MGGLPHGNVEVRVLVLAGLALSAGDGGVFRRFAADAAARRAVKVVASEAVRWPLVHADDLAQLHAVVLDQVSPKSSYIGAAANGVPVGRTARAYAKRYGAPDQTLEIVTTDAIAAGLGEWARGYALDQQLSGNKARQGLGWRPAHLDPMREIAGP